jgi:hypothetical protein
MRWKNWLVTALGLTHFCPGGEARLLQWESHDCECGASLQEPMRSKLLVISAVLSGRA